MKKDIKSIQGRQAPNPIQPECIRVPKVYDWVVITNRDQNKVPIPDATFEQIEACRHAGGAVTATCSEIAGTRRCDFVRSRPANIPNVPNARIVTLAIHVHIRVVFSCSQSGITIPPLEIPVSFVDDVILCFPDGTTINCEIFDVECSVVFSEMLGNMLLIDVVVCKDVQVEREVKLEVEAKFCGPRAALPIEELAPQCQRFPNFPEQCGPLFPPDNCTCRGSALLNNLDRTILVVSGVGPVPTPVRGRLSLNSTICDQCTLAKSNLTVTFQDFPQEDPAGEDPVDQSFTFYATQFNMPTCDAGLTTLTVTGFGKYQQAGQEEEDAQFQLILTEPNRVVLRIEEQGGYEVLAYIDVTGGTVNVDACQNF
ncbi:hypothetical protein [Bacillus sp. REN3]|uniref:hypothetical protein n=1 Tax=Bacillus sp. REN3 TaxID=2802440 RepID=UPI001AEECDCF|nr:hypothetical protein [Bacillus sp. REN3]